MKLPEIHPDGVEEYPKIGNYLPGFIGHIMVFSIHCVPPESVYWGNGCWDWFPLVVSSIKLLIIFYKINNIYYLLFIIYFMI